MLATARFTVTLLAASWVLIGQPAAADDAKEVPKSESAKRACSTAQGKTKQECEKVAKQIDQQRANPDANPSVESQTSSQEVHHSGPAMKTPEEAKQEKQPNRPK
jgi:hypothetical protein